MGKDVDMTKVDRPAHYDGDDCMLAMESMGLGWSYCVTSAFKYLWRLGKKVDPGETPKQAALRDLAKVRWCLNRAGTRMGIVSRLNHIADRWETQITEDGIEPDIEELKQVATSFYFRM